MSEYKHTKEPQPITSIKNIDKPFGLDVKRGYLPLVIKAKCPFCGLIVERDLSNVYVSYPVLNQTFDYTMYHYNEETGDKHEFPVRIQLSISAKEVIEDEG